MPVPFRHLPWAALGLALALAASGALAQASPADRHLRAIYQELVEINTTDSVGDCTVAARAMAARLKAGGYRDDEMQLVVPPQAPKKGNLVVRLKGSLPGEQARKGLLLLAHIDVVEARREDWARDPFKLVEENGYFYARGSSDDKAMAAIYVSTLIRYRQEAYVPKKDIALALTCDEELIPAKANGVEYLLANHRDLIQAELALNEGGGGSLDEADKPVVHSVQAAEKIFQTFQLEITNKGGHSSVPVPDNAIYRLSEGLARLSKFQFPFKLSPVTRRYFEVRATLEPPAVAADMRAILQTPPDEGALKRLYDRSAYYNAAVRTTCVATMVEAGHATNALPQRAKATVNCRILPGEKVADVQAALARVLADADIRITTLGTAVEAPEPPLAPALMAAIEKTSNELWPGVPIITTMSSGATDSRFTNGVGLPSYGVTGLFGPPSGSNAHGLNERLRVQSLYEGAEFNHRLLRRLAGG